MKLVVVALTFLGLSASVAALNPVSGREMKQRVPCKSPPRHPDRSGMTPRPRRPPAATDLYGEPLPPRAVARLGTLRDNIGFISSDIIVSPDGKAVTATSSFFAIPLRLWDVASGRIIRELRELDLGGRRAVRVTVVAFSPDSEGSSGCRGYGRNRADRQDGNGPQGPRNHWFRKRPAAGVPARRQDVGPCPTATGPTGSTSSPRGRGSASPRCPGAIFTAGGSVLALQRSDDTVIAPGPGNGAGTGLFFPGPTPNQASRILRSRRQISRGPCRRLSVAASSARGQRLSAPRGS